MNLQATECELDQRTLERDQTKFIADVSRREEAGGRRQEAGGRNGSGGMTRLLEEEGNAQQTVFQARALLHLTPRLPTLPPPRINLPFSPPPGAPRH